MLPTARRESTSEWGFQPGAGTKEAFVASFFFCWFAHWVSFLCNLKVRFHNCNKVEKVWQRVLYLHLTYQWRHNLIVKSLLNPVWSDEKLCFSLFLTQQNAAFYSLNTAFSQNTARKINFCTTAGVQTYVQARRVFSMYYWYNLFQNIPMIIVSF